MIYLASDHAGYRLKEEIKDYLDELGIKYRDLGPKSHDPDDDYPDFAFKVAEKVVPRSPKATYGTPSRKRRGGAKNSDEDRGILICGTGQGMMRAANRVKGIRAILAWDEFTAEMAKAHLNANILTLGGNVTPLKTAKKIVATWLSTGFSGDERHKRRLKKIEGV